MTLNSSGSGSKQTTGVQETPDESVVHAWHALKVADALSALNSDKTGLTSAEAARRLGRYGLNELPRPQRPSALRLYLRQFKNPLVYLLLGATLISLAIGKLTDAAFIFVVLQLNAAIGTFQEWRAGTSAEALDALIRNVAVVLRDAAPRRLDAESLVPGDVVNLESGTRVPADLRLLSSRELTVDESLLTGESLSVSKDPEAVCAAAAPMTDRRNMLHAGTTVLSGRATAVVVETGTTTEVGRIAQALALPDTAPPPLIVQLARFSRVIGAVTLLLIAFLAMAQFAQGLSLATVILVAVALAVAAIPEGLPVAITVALSIATNRMARRSVIVRALPAVEGLGACTVIASDKTGTLTCNELTIKRILLPGVAAAVDIGGEGYFPQGAVTISDRPLQAAEQAAVLCLAESGALCNEARLRVVAGEVEHLGDTVDVAFLTLAAKLNLERATLSVLAPQQGIIPFEPRRRYAATFTAALTADGGDSGQAVVHVKGAAEVVLPMCSGVDADRVREQAENLAAAGYRVLAVARGPVTLAAAQAARPDALQNLELLGFVGLIDPLRPEVPAAVATCKNAGIKPLMITGDHPKTALAIARELGIAQTSDQVVTGADLITAGGDQAAFGRLIGAARVFARVEPVQKMDIVRALQRGGHVVAVTGDGVNDAPALSAADIGVAMGQGGTDVARGAADLILADDNFASIVGGVEEGRIAYANVRKLIYLLITTGLGEIVLFLFAIVSGLPLPLFAVQLLWLNLVTNGIQHVALAFERGEPGILERPPRPPDQSLFDRRMIAQVSVAGTYMGLAGFLFYNWCLAQGMPESEARNLLLLLMVLFENVHVFDARSEVRSAFRVPVAANPFVVMAAAAALAVHVAAMYLPGLSLVLDVAPISASDWAMVVAIALTLLAVMEVYKWLFVRSRLNG